MEEKKLTDEKAFTLSGITEWLSTKAKTDEDMYYVGAIAGTYLACERLQIENAEQKAEIERLEKDVHDMSWIIKIHKYCVGVDHCQNSSTKEFKLQKQVDELTEGKRKLELLSLRLMNDEGHQQTVKDTAREIYDFAKEFYSSNEDIFGERLKAFVKRYGVEVE